MKNLLIYGTVMIFILIIVSIKYLRGRIKRVKDIDILKQERLKRQKSFEELRNFLDKHKDVYYSSKNYILLYKFLKFLEIYKFETRFYINPPEFTIPSDHRKKRTILQTIFPLRSPNYSDAEMFGFNFRRLLILFNGVRGIYDEQKQKTFCNNVLLFMYFLLIRPEKKNGPELQDLYSDFISKEEIFRNLVGTCPATQDLKKEMLNESTKRLHRFKQIFRLYNSDILFRTIVLSPP